MKLTVRLLVISALTISSVGVVAAPAFADDASYCNRLGQLARNDGLFVRLAPSDSYSVAAAKVSKVRTNFVSLNQVTPVELKPTTSRIISTLAKVRSDLLALKSAKGSKAVRLNQQVTDRLELFGSDTDILEVDALERCEVNTDVIVDSEIVNPATPTATVPAGLLNGTGVYVVGQDISVGPWTTRGGPNCVAGLTNDPTGQDATMGFIVPVNSGVTTLMITSDYRYFFTKDCPGWRKGTLA
jgi:hypothetical protein